MHEAFAVLKLARIEPPAFLMLSFLGVRGYWMYVGPQWAGSGARTIGRDNLIAPELVLDTYDLDEAQTATLMRPLFDSIWNACGWERSINYDEQGKWRMAR